MMIEKEPYTLEDEAAFFCREFFKFLATRDPMEMVTVEEYGESPWYKLAMTAMEVAAEEDGNDEHGDPEEVADFWETAFATLVGYDCDIRKE